MIIVTCDATSLRESERLRAELRDGDMGEVRAMRIGTVQILLLSDAAEERVDRIQSILPSAQVLVPGHGTPLADRTTVGTGSIVSIGAVDIGGPEFVVAAGPCAVESLDQLKTSAAAVKQDGARLLRGGAYKPRTSPHSFQGLYRTGIDLLAQARAEFGLPVVSEVVDPRDVEHMADKVDMLQIGTRNAQNYSLLTEAGRSGIPVLLKRGFGCTVDEWLGAAEYVLREGNARVVLCERGIRTFESSTRFTLDLAAVAVLKRRTHLPVIVDPSHSVGQRDLVIPMALAAAAAGADGLLVDVHCDPTAALCDGAQALPPAEFADLMSRLADLLTGLDRSFHSPDFAVSV